MIAILSDIHGNLEALEAVLKDAVSFEIERIVCLGDLVGYGPDPIPCVERAREWHFVLRGFYDLAAVLDDDLAGWSSASAKNSILRFREELQQHPQCRELTDFLTALPTLATIGDALFVHGSPRGPTNEFLFPEDIYNTRKMDAIAERVSSLCFCGNTHIPGIFYRGESGWKYLSPAECGDRFPLTVGKILCTVGSVGQPRDLDPRACYVLYSKQKIIFRRVDYDRELTIRKIRERGDDDLFGQRLRDGR